MESAKLLFGALLFYLVYRFESTYFVQKGAVLEISGDNLYLDESFFGCIGKPNCNTLQRGTERQTWDKVVYRSCKEAWRPEDLDESTYWIHFKGTSSPVEVRCTKENGMMVVHFDHNNNEKRIVSGYEPPGSYKEKIVYKSPIVDIISVTDNLSSCKQFTRIDCYGMILFKDNNHFGYLVDRNGEKMDYLGGGNATGRGCECGMTNTCLKPNTLCNCDGNMMKWLFDEGYVTEKSRLPITEVRLGDTGNNEYGKITVGALKCIE